MAIKRERIGFTFINKQGCKGTIVEYRGASKVYVKFEEGDGLVSTTFDCCKKGAVRNPYFPIVRGIGFIGIGKFKTTIKGKETKAYIKWKSMFARCYSGENPTYEGCSVCEWWHNFQNFAEWYSGKINEHNIDFELDKDILVKGNKFYSPETCCLVPHEINTLTLKSSAIRGELPIGVTKINNGKFSAAMQIEGRKRKHLGCFTTPELAFEAYKVAKEELIREKAKFYKKVIESEVYEALLKYEVEIND